MRLGEAVQTYIAMKQALGRSYVYDGGVIWSFAKHLSEVPLRNITHRQILTFLGGPRTSPVTWHHKYSILKNFFLYWTARRELSETPMPPCRPLPAASGFVPHIYTRTEIRKILAAIPVSQKHKGCKIAPKTLRAFLIFLYGTGALVSEATNLASTDVNLRKKTILIHGSRFDRSRTIPIGSELCGVLQRYVNSLSKQSRGQSSYFFVNRDGERLNTRTLTTTFQRLRDEAGVQRHDHGFGKPRMHDLRHTFAVHRLNAWFKNHADMSRVIPALSAYIGQVGLGSTERYLRLAPERFRVQLNALSPLRSRKHWRDDPALMKFLAAL